ncbi:autotransporter-associated beta strand repeat-containing protein, partial [Amorphus sp. 3PC139-8]|uniref:autotransporter-associated beta strand repeat-containing protein n=1 Tax=Amorphus sp. 3PC139-8 TaxID=2735676 RepID=UPI00345CEECC
MSVDTDGTLGGTGTLKGNVTVDGTLSPGASPGTLTIAGNLVLNSGSTSLFEFNTPDVSAGDTNDFVSVDGNLTLGGTLDATVGSAGYYYLFDYNGSLSGDFDTIKVSAPGELKSSLDTATTGQVNITVKSAAHEMGFWDGTQMAGSGTVTGGDGVWNDSNTNWTDSNGSENTIWGSSVGVFMGAAGTVTVEGTQTFDTLQFKTDGYELTGGTLGLSPAEGANGTVNVDGGVTATIASTIEDGTGNIFNKTGSGTLVLTGANTYTGNTLISGGTLQVAAEEALGKGSLVTVAGGGTLATTETIDLQRDVSILRGAGALAPAAGTTLTVSSAIDGLGALIMSGDGTLVLSGANTYTGRTEIAAGTLQVAADAPFGSTFNRLELSGGTLSTTASFDMARAVNLTGSTGGFDVASGTTLGLSGTVSGSGALMKSGAGTLVLTGTNSYTGGTQVAAGRLIGDTGSIQGDIANAGTVEFAQASDGTFAGAIGGLSGSDGQMVKSGAGALTLTGTSSLDWSILDGSVISTTELFTGDAMVDAGTSLVFDQGFDGAYGGAITGTGDVLYTGGGLVTLTGDNSGYQGETTVRDFTLTLGDNTVGGTLLLGNGGRLAGNGTVGATTVQSGGTIAPGNSIGTVNVAGDLTFMAGSTYEVETEPGGTSADLIHATGIATLAGDVLHIGFDGAYAPESEYTILTADGGVSGTFDGVSSSFTFLDPLLGYTANSVNLTLRRNDIRFTSVAQTPNQGATASALDGLTYGNPLYDAVVVLNEAAAPAAFDALSGEIHASLKTGLIEDSRFVR